MKGLHGIGTGFCPEDRFVHRTSDTNLYALTGLPEPKFGDERGELYPAPLRSTRWEHIDAPESETTSSNLSSARSISYTLSSGTLAAPRLESTHTPGAALAIDEVRLWRECPVPTCEYRVGWRWRRRVDWRRHILTHFEGIIVCDFCHDGVTVAERSFIRIEDFKRHLKFEHLKGRLVNKIKEIKASICSTCNAVFTNPLDLYHHLDDCVICSLEKAEPVWASNSGQIMESAVEGKDKSLLRATLGRHIPSSDQKALTRTINTKKTERDENVDDSTPETIKCQTHGLARSMSEAKATSPSHDEFKTRMRLSDACGDVITPENGEGRDLAALSEPYTTHLDLAVVQRSNGLLNETDQKREDDEEISRSDLLLFTDETESNSPQIEQAAARQVMSDSTSTSQKASLDNSCLYQMTNARSIKEVNNNEQAIADDTCIEVSRTEATHASHVGTPQEGFQQDSLGYNSPLSETSDLTVTEELNASTWNFVDELAKHIVSRCIDYHNAAFRSNNDSKSPTSSSPPSQTKDTPATSQFSSSKRQKRSHTHGNNGSGNGNDEEEEDDDTAPKKHKRGASKPARLWACPFNKFDPMRYSEQNQSEKAYRKCASVTLTDISVVKQHLRRNHREPDFYCGKCYVTFKLKANLLQHNKSDCAPAPEKYKEMMTDEQYKSIPKYLLNTSESWYTIFSTLFKDAERPVSPYIATCDPATLQRFVELFRWIGPQEFLSLARGRLENEPHSLQLNAPLRMLIEETFGAAFPEYMRQLCDTMSQRNPDCVERINAPHGQMTEAVPGANSPGADNFDASWHIDPEQWLQNPVQVDEGFAMFDANLFGETYISTRSFT